MGRKAKFVTIIAALSVFAFVCASAQAQPQRSNGRQSGQPPHHAPPIDSMRQRWLSLPPTAQQDFRRNAERWLRMSPQERQIMRQREAIRRERIKRETEAALRDSGLLLDQERRNLFESRYMQERRKMEQALRQQIEAERQQQLPTLIQELKKEFQSQQPKGSTVEKPTASPRKDR